MHGNHAPVLAGLLGSASVNRFLTDHWPERAFFTHGDPARLAAFLRAPELANIEALACRYQGTLRFTQGRHYQKMIRIDQVDAMALYRMGLTLQFEDVTAAVPAAGAALRGLEAELGINPGAACMSVFASPVEEGLSVHFDAQDIFSIQLKGSKVFHIAPVDDLRYPSGSQFVPGSEPFDALYPQAVQGFPDVDRAHFTTVEMQPGSVLYMPRGTWHHTESRGDSLSVSIGLYVPSALDCLLSQLEPLLLQDEAWRRPLYGAWGRESARQAATSQAAALLQRLPAQLASLTAGEFIDQLRPAEARMSGLQPRDRFQKTPHSTLEVETQETGNSEIRSLALQTWEPNYGTRTTVRMKVHREAVEAFRWLADQDRPFTVEDFFARCPRFARAEQHKMLQVAVEGGLLRPLWYPVLMGAPAAGATP
jgi:ribosomal protein L16 Arg81 hydroxylase